MKQRARATACLAFPINHQGITTMTNVLSFPGPGAASKPEPMPPLADALSFVVRRTPNAEGGGFNYWNVQRTGAYVTDRRMGRALGEEFVEFLGRYPTLANAGLLGLIVNDIRANSPDATRLGGVEIGFLSAIGDAVLNWGALQQSIERGPSR
jgi:hypothetical protein